LRLQETGLRNGLVGTNRVEARPAFFAFEPVPIRPVFRSGAGDDQVETIAIGMLAEYRCALDV
jgi:hypothetical protein